MSDRTQRKGHRVNTPSQPDPRRCGKMQDHDKHVWRGRVEEVWASVDDYGRPYPTVSRGPWYECSGHLIVEGGHW